MSTLLANPVDMIRQGAPHLVASEKELAVYTESLFNLTAKAKPSRYEEEAIALPTLLIDEYESRRYPIPDAAPEDVLRFLIDVVPAYDLAGKPTYTGILEEWWAAPGKSRTTIIAASVKQSEPMLLDDSKGFDPRESYLVRDCHATRRGRCPTAFRAARQP